MLIIFDKNDNTTIFGLFYDNKLSNGRDGRI